MEHCFVFMNSWDVSDVFWSFSKCNITIPHFPTVPSTVRPWHRTAHNTITDAATQCANAQWEAVHAHE